MDSSNVTKLGDHMALVCSCGSVNFALLKSGGIECNKCGLRQSAEWAEDEPDWQPIASAPKDCAILLWIDAVDGSAATAWQGSWCWVSNEWVLHLPFEVEFKRAVITAKPTPTHWKYRLPPPK